MIRFVLAGMLLIFLSSCVGVPTSVSSPDIVVLWHTFEAASYHHTLQTLGDRFNAEHPEGPTLIVEYQDNIVDKLDTLPALHQPDLVVAQADDVSQFRSRGRPFDLPYTLQQDLLPMATSLYTDAETMYALPLGLTTYVIYYNQVWARDLGYQAASATADDLLNIACAATDMEGGQIGLGIPAQADILISLLATGGAPIVGHQGTYVFEDAEVVTAANLGHDLLSRGCARLYEYLDVGIDQFADSTMTLMIASSLHEPDIVERVLDGRNFTMGVTGLPAAEGSGGSLWRGPALLLLTETGPRHDAARDVALWMLSSEAQEVWFKETNFLPVRRSLIEAWLDDPEMRTTRRELLTLTLEVAEQENWSTWLPVTDEPECRAALVRALFDLNTDQPVTEVLASAQEACQQAAGE